MFDDFRKQLSRRTFAQSMAASLTIASQGSLAMSATGALSQTNSSQDEPETRKNSHLTIGCLVYPRQDQIDFTGNPGKGLFARMNSELFGNGLLTSDGDFWRRQRRLSSPAFHRQSIDRYAEITVEEAVQVLAGWEQGDTHDIHDDMMSIEWAARAFPGCY